MASKYRTNWSRDELLIAFNLYCGTPFGQLHQHNPQIIQIAEAIGRTPSAVGMKCCNFASLDPTHQARSISGLGNVSKSDNAIWVEFHENWSRLAVESETALENIANSVIEDIALTSGESQLTIDYKGPSTRERVVEVRLVQSFFRRSVLAAYEGQCAMCHLAVRSLLNASHIIPWKTDESRRADPTNGLCLCALHDRAFDRGLLAVSNDMQVMVSDRLHIQNPPDLHDVALLQIAGKELQLPHRFAPDPIALQSHRESVFVVSK